MFFVYCFATLWSIGCFCTPLLCTVTFWDYGDKLSSVVAFMIGWPIGFSLAILPWAIIYDMSSRDLITPTKSACECTSACDKR